MKNYSDLKTNKRQNKNSGSRHSITKEDQVLNTRVIKKPGVSGIYGNTAVAKLHDNSRVTDAKNSRNSRNGEFLEEYPRG